MYFNSLSASCTITDEVGRTMLKCLTLCDLWLVVNESLTWMNFLATQASAKLRNSFTWTKLHAHTGLACYAFLVLRTGSLVRHPYSPLAYAAEHLALETKVQNGEGLAHLDVE